LQLLGNEPPPTQEEIRRAQQRQLEGKAPDMTPRQKMEKEMVEILRAAQHNTALINEKNYYRSSYYLNDLPAYERAKELIRRMLEDSAEISVKDAYYFSEAAYGRLHLTYSEYTSLINANAGFVRQWLKENNYALADQEAMHFGIQKFLSDTLYVTMEGKKQGHIPYYYDYIDATSEGD